MINLATKVTNLQDIKEFAQSKYNIDRWIEWNGVYYILIKNSEPKIKHPEFYYPDIIYDLSSKPSIWRDVNGFIFDIER